ncbi:MAG TPA: efflux RND transporter periplasmic adaptor subunit [Bryobacteraceae bacterium]|nr:efflux RND transporter periplasmic adaptor subunit [Bryobacteraceae bacterium]
MSPKTILSSFLAAACFASAQRVELVAVISKTVSRSIDLPGEIAPFLSVLVRAKVAGYVEKIPVDRGSVVKQGDILAELSAPEMASHIAEEEGKIQAIESERLQAEAQLGATQATYERLKKASETPGAIAENELIQMRQQIEATRALIASRRQSGQAAQANLRALKELQSYLHITAPFDGVVTDRLVHPGAFVGPSTDSPLVILQQISKLRLVVPVPEEDCGTLAQGAAVSFHVPAFPDRTFSGVIARSAHALDPKTRTMAVELDVINRDGSLAPGMFPTISWPIRRARPALLVPASSVVTTTERIFVIRDQEGRAEWVDVKKGAAQGDLIEVIGGLHAGDKIVRRASDELRDGSRL